MMRWYYIFTKGLREQLRDYWILIMILVMAPLFIAIYFLMSSPDMLSFDVALVNQDRGPVGDSLVNRLLYEGAEYEGSGLNFMRAENRGEALVMLRKGKADAIVIIPENFSLSLEAVSIPVKTGPTSAKADSSSAKADPTSAKADSSSAKADPTSAKADPSSAKTDYFPAEASSGGVLELVGNITSMEYIVAAIWSEELINDFILEAAGLRYPLTWKETALGHSAGRSEFEIYVPGLLILSIIMIIFSASAAIVREVETRTLERLKISRLSSLEFLGGISLVQIIIAILSLLLALLTAMALGYTLIPGSLGFILLISFLTALSMISFSLLVAAMCRSVKEVAIIGTFPLFLLMFFTGAAFPISGGRLFSIGDFDFMLNHLLSPTWSIQALNKVLVKGLEAGECLPEMAAILVLTVIYGFMGTWAFRRRHMRAE